MEYKIHDRLPNGFSYADEIQTEQYNRRGVVNGARKVCFVADGDDKVLALQLHPPKSTKVLLRREIIKREVKLRQISLDALLEWYIAEYNAGQKAAARGTDSKAWDSGMTSAAWDDGYLDRAAGRPKWHLTHCVDHDRCGEG